MFALDLFVPILFCVRNIYTDLTRVACANEFPWLSVNICIKSVANGKEYLKYESSINLAKKGRISERSYEIL